MDNIVIKIDHKEIKVGNDVRIEVELPDGDTLLIVANHEGVIYDAYKHDTDHLATAGLMYDEIWSNVQKNDPEQEGMNLVIDKEGADYHLCEAIREPNAPGGWAWDKFKPLRVITDWKGQCALAKLFGQSAHGITFHTPVQWIEQWRQFKQVITVEQAEFDEIMKGVGQTEPTYPKME